MLFVVLGVSNGAAENVDVKELYRPRSVHHYDLSYNYALYELTFVYEIRARSGEKKITREKLTLKNNRIYKQTAAVTTYTFPDRKYFKRHKFDIDLFNNFGEFFFTDIDINNDGYKERVITNYIDVYGIWLLKAARKDADREEYEEYLKELGENYVNYDNKTAIHILIQDGKTTKYILDKVIDLNTRFAWTSPHGIVPMKYKDMIIFLVLFGCNYSISGENFFFRLYDNNWNLLFQSAKVGHFSDGIGIIAPTIIDLDRDGNEEIILSSYFVSKGEYTGIDILKIIKSKDAPRTIYLRPGRDRFYGEDVKFIQRRLLAEGINIGPDGVDGYYGPDTRKGIIEFQKRKELLVTGVVDKAMWEALKKEKKE